MVLSGMYLWDDEYKEDLTRNIQIEASQPRFEHMNSAVFIVHSSEIFCLYSAPSTQYRNSV